MNGAKNKIDKEKRQKHTLRERFAYRERKEKIKELERLLPLKNNQRQPLVRNILWRGCKIHKDTPRCLKQ